MEETVRLILHPFVEVIADCFDFVLFVPDFRIYSHQSPYPSSTLPAVKPSSVLSPTFLPSFSLAMNQERSPSLTQRPEKRSMPTSEHTWT